MNEETALSALIKLLIEWRETGACACADEEERTVSPCIHCRTEHAIDGYFYAEQLNARK